MLCLPVLNAPGASRSLENRGRALPPSSARSTNWFRKRGAVSLASHASVLIASSAFTAPCPATSPLPPPPHSLSLYDDGAESIGPRSSYSSGSLSQRKIYVNRHVDTCSNVARARARAERGEERFAGEGLGSRVTGMQCRISRSPGYRVQGGGGGEEGGARNAHLEMQWHVGGCIRIRARDTHARLAVS